jgi:hypothetical protein
MTSPMPRREQIAREMDTCVYGPGCNEMLVPKDMENPGGPSPPFPGPQEVPKELPMSCPGELDRSNVFLYSECQFLSSLTQVPKIVPIHVCIYVHIFLYIHVSLFIYIYISLFIHTTFK